MSLTLPQADPGSPGSSVFDLPTGHTSHQDAVRLREGQLSSTDSTSRHNASSDIPEAPSCLVISGGTGCNAICAAFGAHNASYVLPVSDDGGSSSEIIRVMGGPSIGTSILTFQTVLFTILAV